jgi:hypothetical protein
MGCTGNPKPQAFSFVSIPPPPPKNKETNPVKHLLQPQNKLNPNKCFMNSSHPIYAKLTSVVASYIIT